MVAGIKKFILPTMVAIHFFACCSSSSGQDTQDFRVSVGEAISLHSPGDVLISHDRTNDDQVFPEQAWTAYTTNTAGATVSFTIGRFIHESFFFFRRNSRIELRIVATDPTANWTTTTSVDQTTGFFFGNPTATVSAESFGAGAGQLGINVDFLEFNGNFLAAGRYNATVVGQISNK